MTSNGKNFNPNWIIGYSNINTCKAKAVGKPLNCPTAGAKRTTIVLLAGYIMPDREGITRQPLLGEVCKLFIQYWCYIDQSTRKYPLGPLPKEALYEQMKQRYGTDFDNLDPVKKNVINPKMLVR